MDLGNLLKNENLKKFVEFLTPLWLTMTPEQKRQFIIELAEAVARGAAEGVIRGAKEKQ